MNVLVCFLPSYNIIHHVIAICITGPCLVHELKNWLTFLARRNNGSIPPEFNILQQECGSIVTASKIRKWLAAQCDILQWDKNTHKPYSLKIGRAEDLYYLGLPQLAIMDIGCWRTPCFMRYIRPQERDNLFLLKKKTNRCSLTVLAKQNIKFQNYVGNNKAKRYEMCYNIRKKPMDDVKYLYKAKDGLLKPCLLQSKSKDDCKVVLMRCGKQKTVSMKQLIPYQAELEDKPHRHTKNNKYVSVINQLFV